MQYFKAEIILKLSSVQSDKNIHRNKALFEEINRITIIFDVDTYRMYIKRI